MSKTVRNVSCSLNCYPEIIVVFRKDFCEYFVNNVWVATFNGKFESLLKLLCLKEEGYFLDNGSLLLNKEVSKILFLHAVCNLSKLCEVNVYLNALW